MKKLLSIILAMAIAMSMAVPAIAENPESDAEIKLTVTQKPVYGEPFTLKTEFGKQTASNLVVLDYTWDAGLFEYAGFTLAEGVEHVGTKFDSGIAEITVMTRGYNAKVLGDFMLLLKSESANLTSAVNVSADYVVKDSNDKSVKNSAASADVLILPAKFTLIDLSNLIDWFDFDETHPDWNTKYIFWDFNNDGRIDIYDVVYVARLIDFSTPKEPEPVSGSFRAVYLGGEEFFNETIRTSFNAPVETTTYKIAPAVGTLEPGEVYDITVLVGVVMEAEVSQVAVQVNTLYGGPAPLEGLFTSATSDVMGRTRFHLDNGAIYIVPNSQPTKYGFFSITRLSDSAIVEYHPPRVGSYLKFYNTPVEQNYTGARPVDAIYMIG